MVYSTIPGEAIKQQPGQDRYKIMTLLKSFPGKWFKSYEIAEKCGFPDSNTNVEVRLAITELIEFDKCPIVSTNAGFCWTTQKSMVLNYIERLRYRQQGIERRIRTLTKIAGWLE